MRHAIGELITAADDDPLTHWELGCDVQPSALCWHLWRTQTTHWQKGHSMCGPMVSVCCARVGAVNGSVCQCLWKETAGLAL